MLLVLLLLIVVLVVVVVVVVVVVAAAVVMGTSALWIPRGRIIRYDTTLLQKTKWDRTRNEKKGPMWLQLGHHEVFSQYCWLADGDTKRWPFQIRHNSTEYIAITAGCLRSRLTPTRFDFRAGHARVILSSIILLYVINQTVPLPSSLMKTKPLKALHPC